LPFTNFDKPGLAKIAPWCQARQDRISAKAGHVTGVTAPPTLSAHTRNRQAVQKPPFIVNNLSAN
jgi:hypothetical protein